MTNNKNTDNAVMGRNSDGVLRLRMVCGLAGYAVYVMLGEKLNEEGGSIPADYFAIAFDFHADAGLVKQVAEDFGLFSLSSDGKTIKRKEENKETEKLPLDPLKEKENKKETENNREEKKKKAEDEKLTDSAEPAATDVDKKDEQKDDKSKDDNKPKRKYTEAEIDKFCADFQAYWNEIMKWANSRLRPIAVIDKTRRARLAFMRRRFTGKQINSFIYNAARSPFLNARNGQLRQPADINWMLASEERIVKIIEGNL